MEKLQIDWYVMQSKNSETYAPFTPKLMLQQVAPHTWPAAIMPALLATALAIHDQGSISVSVSLACLLICVLFQSAANTFNDYIDYKKGADTIENQMDATDAVLVFNHINPATVKNFAYALIACAFVIGAYVIYVAGWIPLVIGIIGALAVLLYSGGKLPVSYLPIGEFVSGFVMGTLIMLATYQALTLNFNLNIVIYSLPELIGIGLVLMTNNTCDIEKDIQAQRKTLPVIRGREKARSVYHLHVYMMVTLVCLYALVSFRGGLIIVPFMLLALYPFIKALCANPLVLQSRVAAMSQILTVNVVVGAFFTAIILCDGFACFVL